MRPPDRRAPPTPPYEPNGCRAATIPKVQRRPRKPLPALPPRMEQPVAGVARSSVARAVPFALAALQDGYCPAPLGLAHVEQVSEAPAQPFWDGTRTLDARWCLFGQRFQLLEEIGRGNSRVYRALDMWSRRMVACKVVPHDGDESRRAYVRREFVYARDAACRYSAAYLNYYLCVREDVLVMELCARGDLLEYMRRLCEIHALVREAALWKVLAQLSYAILACHAAGVVHADVKPQNVFFAHGGVRLGDFGLAARYRTRGRPGAVEPPPLFGPAGTEDYEAPELLMGAGFTALVDIWGFGCVAYELAAGRPFCGIPRAKLRSRDWSWHAHVEQRLQAVIERGYSSRLVALIRQCLSPAAHLRPRASDVYRHCAAEILPELRES